MTYQTSTEELDEEFTIEVEVAKVVPATYAEIFLQVALAKQSGKDQVQTLSSLKGLGKHEDRVSAIAEVYGTTEKQVYNNVSAFYSDDWGW